VHALADPAVSISGGKPAVGAAVERFAVARQRRDGRVGKERRQHEDAATAR
jgi:hypothetical protein